MPITQSQRILLHFLCWGIFFSLPILFIFPGSSDKELSNAFNALAYLLIYPAFFYLHGKLVFPKLFFRKRYLLYGLSLVVMFAVVARLQPFEHLIGAGNMPAEVPAGVPPMGVPAGPPPSSLPARAGKGGPPFDIISVALLMIVISFSIALVLAQRWIISARRAADAEAFRAKAELSSLKAQINPHFLFNTLNNIYSLALTKDENAPQAIMMLSNIMRYATDEAGQDVVPLQAEADCIRDFIELNRLRLGSKIRFNYSIGGDMEGKTIAPLLLITFVENVFKYGISNSEVSEINIYLISDKDKTTFFCQNKIFPDRVNQESLGIGVANARKRLEYLYPDRHELHIRDDDGNYTVTMVIHRKGK